MPKFCANLTLLFKEVDFISRFDEAKKAGFKGVEFQFPYAFNLDQIAEKLQSNQLEMVLFNLPAGNWEMGDRGLAANPNRIAEFRDGVEKGIVAAKKLGVKQLNCLGGLIPQGVSEDKIFQTFAENIRFAADELKKVGLRLLVEPVNDKDNPGVYLSDTQKTVDLIKASGSDNAFLQLDIYHTQRMKGELARTIQTYLPMIKHMQLADNPGRHEPGTGEINYRFLFRLIDELGYDGWIGCEYHPETTTKAGLGWMASHRT